MYTKLLYKYFDVNSENHTLFLEASKVTSVSARLLNLKKYGKHFLIC